MPSLTMRVEHFTLKIGCAIPVPAALIFLLTIMCDDDVATLSLLDVALAVSAIRKVCTPP